PPPPRPPPFPYTTLFRSAARHGVHARAGALALSTSAWAEFLQAVRAARHERKGRMTEKPGVGRSVEGVLDLLKDPEFCADATRTDRKSTRLNSSHRTISY